MGKVVETKYICDRCGKEIVSVPCSVMQMKEIFFFKWLIRTLPWHIEYKTHCICQECFDSFTKWYTQEDKHEETK